MDGPPMRRHFIYIKCTPDRFLRTELILRFRIKRPHIVDVLSCLKGYPSDSSDYSERMCNSQGGET